MSKNKIDYVAVDWGSTRLRVYGLTSGGECVIQHQQNTGMASLHSPSDFSACLEQILICLEIDSSIPIILAGMVGARGGWLEIPYCAAPVAISELAQYCQIIPHSHRKCYLVPGVCMGIFSEQLIANATECLTKEITEKYTENTTKNVTKYVTENLINPGFSDVMRGEETQAFGVGLEYPNACVIAPGTHSKWIVIQNNIIQQFSTYPTGELYAVLMQYSLLGKGLNSDNWNQASFLNGIKTALQHPFWLHQLFGVRARQVTNQTPPNELPAFLSGLLLGYECNMGIQQFQLKNIDYPVILIGGQQLTELYQVSLLECGIQAKIVDAENLFCRGIAQIATALFN